MAKKKGKKGKGRRRVKTIPIASTVGTASYGADVVAQTKGAPLDEKLRYAVRSASGLDIKGEVPFNAASISGPAKAMYGGILISTIAPKIPILRTLPKKIPLIGKYLRW